jgi:hypothetical protein
MRAFRAMIGSSNSVQSKGPKTARRLVGATLAAVALVFMVLVSGGEAQACQPGMKSGNSVSLAHQIKPTMVAASQVAFTASDANPGRLASIGHRCAGNSQSGVSSCNTGCCSACSAVVGVSISSLQPSDESIDHDFAAPNGIRSIKPPPHFRPPRTSA